MSERLNPSGDVVTIGDFELRTPGFDGEAVLHVGGAGAVRGEEVAGSFDEVFARHLDEHGVLELRQVQPVGPPEADARTREEERMVTVTGPEVGADAQQVAVVQDEDGFMSWHFPIEAQRETATVRGGGRRTFEIPLRPVASTEGVAETRGPLGFIGRKLLKLFGFKAAGVVGEKIVRHWETGSRPHRIRELTSANLQTYDVGEVASDRWAEFGKGTALLFIHGTNSQIHTGYHALPGDFLDELHKRYGGRVMGFDHPTLSFDPTENMDALAEKLPEGTIELDIVCHSRGGLVARELAERAPQDARFTVRKVIFVATPHEGTALAHTSHIRSFLDTYSNFFQLIPSIGFVDVLECVINVAKEVALNIHGELTGLQSMNPEGPYLEKMNSGGGATASYSAIATEYEPTDGTKFPLWLRDRLFDEVFEKDDEPVANDLVVPTKGCYGLDHAPKFPIEDKLLFESSRGLHHSSFFGEPDVVRFLGDRLQP